MLLKLMALGHNFQMAVNGVMLSASLYESQRLRKLMRKRKMPLLVTTCNARITGGGALPNGRTRGYGIGFDVAALRELDAIKRQRNSEKARLFNVFIFPIIADLAKNKFFALFGNRCYIILGNLVALCSNCNNHKLDLPPEKFYSAHELDRLQPNAINLSLSGSACSSGGSPGSLRVSSVAGKTGRV